MLKLKYQNQSDIPSEYHSLYTEKDGAFLLNLEDAPDPAALDQFRAANLALTKERDALKERFAGIDPDQARRLAEQNRRLEEAQQLKAGEFDKVLQARLGAARAAFEKQISDLTSERDTLTQRLSAIQIDQAAIAAATKHGLHPGALRDLLSRVHEVYHLVNGVPTAFGPDGQTPLTDKAGNTLTPEQWVDSLLLEAPHLFSRPSLGTSPGDGAARSQPNPNPFSRQAWNITEQMRLQSTDPHLAARLQAAAQKQNH